MPKDLSKIRHSRLVRKIRDIFTDSGFITDRNVWIEINGEKHELDVCAVYREVLIITECKTGKNIDFKEEIISWDEKTRLIKNNIGKVTILKSAENVLEEKHLKDIEIVKTIIATDSPEISEDAYSQASKRTICLLDKYGVMYYRITSSALGEWTKYEILKELDIETKECKRSITKPTIEIKQPGYKLYIFSLDPYELLQIAYVFRRSLHEKDAYQRLIKKHRIERISEFLERERANLPNNLIIAFERDTDVSYDEKKREITIPMNYCSAWVVDGQHRLYGFTRTKYSKEPEKEKKKIEKFELIVVGIKGLKESEQASMFVDINYNQKRIDRTLLCDLTTLIMDLRNKLTWPSLLVKELNNNEPWLNRIKTRETHRGRSVTLSSFAQFALLQYLLGYKEKKDEIVYEGPLFKIAPFDYSKSFESRENQEAFEKQIDIVKKYFLAIRKWTAHKNKKLNKWKNFRKYGLTKTTGVNALLLVLNQMLQSGVQPDKFEEFLEPIKNVTTTRKYIAEFGGGWRGFRGFANDIIDELNRTNTLKLEHC